MTKFIVGFVIGVVVPIPILPVLDGLKIKLPVVLEKVRLLAAMVKVLLPESAPSVV